MLSNSAIDFEFRSRNMLCVVIMIPFHHPNPHPKEDYIHSIEMWKAGNSFLDCKRK